MRGPSVMPSVYYLGNAVGISADGHVSDMHGPSVLNIGNAVGDSADGHVSDVRSTTRR